MTIPKLHYITQGNSPEAHLENLQKACSGGAELVQLNLHAFAETACLKLAQEAREITAHFQTRLVISSYFEIAKTVKADGVFLYKNDANPTIVGSHLHSWQTIGGSANTLQECKNRLEKRVDYICLGPFKQSKNTTSATILGTNGFTAIIDELATKTPIIGVGGITTNALKEILETGISGVAVATEITNDFNCIKTYHQLLNASATDEIRHTF